MNNNTTNATNALTKPMLPQDFNKMVRHYVHFDSLTKSYQQQTTNARQMKDVYEDKIIKAMEDSHMTNAVIQIVGGKIVLEETTHPAPLNFMHLERMLHEYFQAKGSKYPDETENILKFIKQNRKTTTTRKLKREMAIPAPEPLTNGLNNS